MIDMKQIWKRLVGALLTLSVMLSGMLVYAEEAQETEQAAAPLNSEAVDILTALQLPGESFGLLDLEEAVTWKEFAFLTAGLLLDAAQLEYEEAMQALINVGLLTADDPIRPEQKVYTEQAAKLYVGILGYAFKAERMGGYPGGYYAVAAQLGLFDGVSVKVGEPLTVYELSHITVNALDVELATTQTGWTEWAVSLHAGDTLLKARFNAIHETARVTANCRSTLTGFSSLKQEEVEIGGVRYKLGDTSADQYLGYQVDFYATKPEDGADGTVLFVKPYRRTGVLHVPASDLEELTAERCAYYTDEGEREELSIDAAANWLYNQFYAAYGSLSAEEKQPRAGYINLIDNNGDGVYDMVSIYDLQPMVVKSVNVELEKIYFDFEQRFRGRESIDLYTNEPVKPYAIYHINGIQMTLEDLRATDVASIGVAKNGKTTVIIVSDLKANGSLEEIAGDKVTIGGTKYKISPYYPTQQKYKLEPGLTGRIYLDGEQNVVAVSREGVSDCKGYVIKVGKEQGLDETVLVKMFDETGEIKIYTFADKVTLYTPETPKGTAKKGAEMAPFVPEKEFVLFSAKSSGEIYKLYTMSDRTAFGPGTLDYPLTLDYRHNSTGDKDPKARFYQGLIYSKYRLVADSVVFVIPSDEGYTEGYKVKKGNFLASNADHYFGGQISFFNVDKYLKIGFMSQISTKTSDTPAINSKLYTVDGIGRAMKGEDEYMQISCYDEGKRVNYFVKNEQIASPSVPPQYEGVRATQLKRGDVVQLSIDDAGFATGMRLLFRQSDPGAFRVINENGAEVDMVAVEKFGFVYGRVSAVDGNALLVNAKGDGKDTANDVVYLTNNPSSKKTYAYSYGKKSGQLKTIAVNDFEEGDIVVLRKEYNSTLYLLKLID